MDTDTENLIPEQKYFIKCKNVNQDGKIINMVVLEAEFIKYNIYIKEFYNYYYYFEPMTPELIGTILTETGEMINYPFEHPLYPYKNFQKKSFYNVGLFRITKCETYIINHEKQINIPNKFYLLNYLTLMNESQINYNKTLMWIDLHYVEIRPVIDKMKILREKAVDSDYFKTLPTDVLPYIKDYLE
jgi:hypothetical protein